MIWPVIVGGGLALAGFVVGAAAGSEWSKVELSKIVTGGFVAFLLGYIVLVAALGYTPPPR